METIGPSRSDRLNNVESQLVDSMALLGSLTGYISHELNNLLTPMRCYAELALRPGSDQKAAQHALELAKEGSDRASRMVQMLLDLARSVPGAGQQQSGSVANSVNGAIRFMPRNPSDDGIEVHSTIPSDLRVALSQDLLDHLVLNIILNARTSMLPKGGTLEIVAGADGSTWNIQSPPMATLTIRDTGRGFVDSDLLRSIQAMGVGVMDQRTQRTFGLDLCRRLVTHARGTFAINSNVGTGTTCAIRLPIAVR